VQVQVLLILGIVELLRNESIWVDNGMAFGKGWIWQNGMEAGGVQLSLFSKQNTQSVVYNYCNYHSSIASHLCELALNLSRFQYALFANMMPIYRLTDLSFGK